MLKQFEQELLKRGCSKNTISSYIRNVRLFLQWLEDSTGVPFDGHITIFDTREYRAFLNTVRKLSPSSINAKLEAVQQFANFLYEQGLQDKIVIERQKYVRYHAVAILDKPQLYKCRRWVHAHGSKRDIAIFELLLNTGLRESELTDLGLDDVTISERKGQMTVRNGKGNKHRELPLNGDARNAIQAYLEQRPSTSDKHLFLGQRGPLTRTAVFKILQHIGRQGAGVRLSPHMLRHQCFTAMSRNGVPLATIAQLAGHSDPKLTAQYYVATNAADREAAVDGLQF